MTGIQIIPCHAPTVQKKKIRSKLGQEILRRLENLPRGEHSVIELVADIKAETGIGSVAARKDFAVKCKDKNSPEAKALVEVGYRYIANIKGGRGNIGLFKPIERTNTA